MLNNTGLNNHYGAFSANLLLLITPQCANTGAKSKHRKHRLWMSMKSEPWRCRGSLSTALYNRHVSTTSSAMSFKSSSTLTTPKEREECCYIVCICIFMWQGRDDKSIFNYALNSHPSAEYLLGVSILAGCLLHRLLTGSAMRPRRSRLLTDAVISFGSFTVSQLHLDFWPYYSCRANSSHTVYTYWVLYDCII